MKNLRLYLLGISCILSAHTTVTKPQLLRPFLQEIYFYLTQALYYSKKYSLNYVTPKWSKECNEGTLGLRHYVSKKTKNYYKFKGQQTIPLGDNPVQASDSLS